MAKTVYQSLFAFLNYLHGLILGNQIVMILDWERQLVESNTAISCFLASQIDKLFIPCIEYAMNFYVEHFPSKLFGMIFSVGNKLLSLFDVFVYSLGQLEFVGNFLKFIKRRLSMRILFLNLFQKRFDRFITDILTNNELVFSNLFIRVIIFIILAEVDSHAPK